MPCKKCFNFYIKVYSAKFSNHKIVSKIYGNVVHVIKNSNKVIFILHV
jgi:hypothetical protein